MLSVNAPQAQLLGVFTGIIVIVSGGSLVVTVQAKIIGAIYDDVTHWRLGVVDERKKRWIQYIFGYINDQSIGTVRVPAMGSPALALQRSGDRVVVSTSPPGPLFKITRAVLALATAASLRVRLPVSK
ncbi:hypothetical protein JB92DRAFT_2832626 [Gautieria morchelliformis]|nr:hypothetical protein JB92DRAFT_2832626 [Gautieria morchelliformis]